MQKKSTSLFDHIWLSQLVDDPKSTYFTNLKQKCTQSNVQDKNPAYNLFNKKGTDENPSTRSTRQIKAQESQIAYRQKCTDCDVWKK
jgi:hypothetical protein